MWTSWAGKQVWGNNLKQWGKDRSVDCSPSDHKRALFKTSEQEKACSALLRFTTWCLSVKIKQITTVLSQCKLLDKTNKRYSNLYKPWFSAYMAEAALYSWQTEIMSEERGVKGGFSPQRAPLNTSGVSLSNNKYFSTIPWVNMAAPKNYTTSNLLDQNHYY